MLEGRPQTSLPEAPHIDGDGLKGPRFNALRNDAFSQTTVESLNHTYSTKGMDGFAAAVTAMVKPA